MAESLTSMAAVFAAVLLALFLPAAIIQPPPPANYITTYLVLLLVILAYADLRYGFLPDVFTASVAVIGLMVNGLTDIGFTDPISAVIGAVAGYFSLFATAFVFRIFTGKEGLGGGDPKLFGAIGAVVGWQPLPAILLIASLLVIAGAAFNHMHRRPGYEIPFGHGLAAGGCAALTTTLLPLG